MQRFRLKVATNVMFMEVGCDESWGWKEIDQALTRAENESFDIPCG